MPTPIEGGQHRKSECQGWASEGQILTEMGQGHATASAHPPGAAMLLSPSVGCPLRTEGVGPRELPGLRAIHSPKRLLPLGKLLAVCPL